MSEENLRRDGGYDRPFTGPWGTDTRADLGG